MELKKLIPRKRRGGEFAREPLGAFHREIDELFDRFFDNGVAWPTSGFSPAVDVNDGDKEVVVSAELPGIDESDLDISLMNDYLTIKGEKREESEKKEDGRSYVERSYGMFHRSIPLPAEVDADKAKASFKKGVLKVTLPKTEESRRAAKKITVSPK
jgi:HSP20 family protein